MIFHAIMAHAEREYPRECCGVVIRIKDDLRYFPCRNMADGDSEFQLHPEDFADASDQGAVVAIVHSHPDGTTKLSEADQKVFKYSPYDWLVAAWPLGHLAGYHATKEG